MGGKNQWRRCSLRGEKGYCVTAMQNASLMSGRAQREHGRPRCGARESNGCPFARPCSVCSHRGWQISIQFRPTRLKRLCGFGPSLLAVGRPNGSIRSLADFRALTTAQIARVRSEDGAAEIAVKRANTAARGRDFIKPDETGMNGILNKISCRVLAIF